MNVRRFIAETARECLRQVKEQLGPDAVVVSNRAVPGGVEIVAMSADGLAALSGRGTQAAAPAQPAAQPRPSAAPAPRPAAPAVTVRDDDYTVSLSAQARKPQSFQTWQPPVHQPAAERPRVAEMPRPPAAEASRPRPLPPKVAPAAVPSQDQVAAAL